MLKQFLKERLIGTNSNLKKTNEAQNRYLDFLIDPSFEVVNGLFVLSFKDHDGRESYKQRYLPTAEIKDYNATIDGRNFSDQPLKNNIKIYNIIKIATGQGDDYTTGYLLDYPYLKKYYKLLAISLSNQQKLDADPKAIQQTNFTRNLNRVEGATMFFIIEEAKGTVLDFSKGTVKVFLILYKVFYFVLI